MTMREMVLMVETQRARDDARVLTTELEHQKHLVEIEKLVAATQAQNFIIQAQASQIDTLVRVTTEKNVEREKDEKYAQDEMPELYDAWGSLKRWPMSWAGHYHWYNDPGLAFAYASTLGLLGVPMILDVLLWWWMAHQNAPPHRATLLWKTVRSLYTLHYANIVTEFLLVVAVPYGFSKGAISIVAAAFAMRVTNELYAFGTLACVLFFTVLLTPRPGDARSAEQIDFSNMTQFWIWFWFAARAKAWIAYWVSWCLPIDLDGKWARPNETRDAKFYRRWSPIFLSASVPMAAAVAAFLILHPGFYARVNREFAVGLGVWGSDAGFGDFFAWVMSVKIPNFIVERVATW